MKHLHYEIHAYSRRSPYPVGQVPEKLSKKEFILGGLVILDIPSFSVKEALREAKKRIKKKGYRVVKIYECQNPEMDLSTINPQEIQIIQLEIQKRMLDFLEGKRYEKS